MLTLRIISLTWLWNRRSVDRVSPRCLCDAAVGIVCPAKVSVGEGCRGLLLNVWQIVFAGLKVMAHCLP